MKAVASVAFLAVLVSFVQGRELLAVFSHINWFFFALSLAISPVLLGASCWKWKILLDVGGHKVPFLRLIAIYLVGYFFSNLLPSTVGGDVVRFYYAGKEINNKSYAAVTVFMERFTGILFLLVLVVLAPLLRPSLYRNPYFLMPALCSFFLLLMVIWMWKVKEPFFLRKSVLSAVLTRLEGGQGRVRNVFLGKTLALAERFLQSLFVRLEKFKAELGKALLAIRQDRVFLAKIVLLTMLFYLLTWINVYFSFRAFGRDVDFLALIALVPTIMFVAHLPVTLLGNLGFFESVFVVYFLLIGVPGAETLAMGLLLRLKMLSLGGVGFVVYLLHQRAWGAAPVEE